MAGSRRPALSLASLLFIAVALQPAQSAGQPCYRRHAAFEGFPPPGTKVLPLREFHQSVVLRRQRDAEDALRECRQILRNEDPSLQRIMENSLCRSTVSFFQNAWLKTSEADHRQIERDCARAFDLLHGVLFTGDAARGGASAPERQLEALKDRVSPPFPPLPPFLSRAQQESAAQRLFELYNQLCFDNSTPAIPMLWSNKTKLVCLSSTQGSIMEVQYPFMTLNPIIENSVLLASVLLREMLNVWDLMQPWPVPRLVVDTADAGALEGPVVRSFDDLVQFYAQGHHPNFALAEAHLAAFVQRSRWPFVLRRLEERLMRQRSWEEIGLTQQEITDFFIWLYDEEKPKPPGRDLFRDLVMSGACSAVRAAEVQTSLYLPPYVTKGLHS
ncbi:unnamed protein product [Vitrella brassicaformis CCMP3155]|uniref:RGS domain-containing protein n=2 Tax=Vitrella brassicaformis TaxID=1169539 RepID=A0A0G4F2C9_VITBC|nr:unnamed protein product [Vitrella brassicaformis CCMP3155]|mmetsp:Transcript_23296/g.57627  ORF Transcript_23296/g.57627 Transcript_23296/m.57627 type:complete len:387 (+) Transcript_23296:79-1239(+)|eukprot:CEM05846.1 unnamed protein product [Vitrella brassicaformis CCMP3155]